MEHPVNPVLANTSTSRERYFRQWKTKLRINHGTVAGTCFLGIVFPTLTLTVAIIFCPTLFEAGRYTLGIFDWFSRIVCHSEY